MKLPKRHSDYVRAGKGEHFDFLSEFLNQDSDNVSYEELAGKMAMSAGALRMAVYRMRGRYRRLLREEITETVSAADEIDAEIRFLIAILSI